MMDVLLHEKIVASPGVLVRELGGEMVLLHLDSEAYFGLDEVGARMWTLLTTADSFEIAFQTLLAEYEVDENLLRQDMTALLEQFLEYGLVEIDRA